MDKLHVEDLDVVREIDFDTALVKTSTPGVIKTEVDKAFSTAEFELKSMRVELSDTPDSESLMKLYEMQSKGRAYYERSAELFRSFLKISSQVTILKQQAEFCFKQQFYKAQQWAQTYLKEELRSTKSGQEREYIVNSLIPEELRSELVNWQSVESQTRVYYNIIKSYQEQFKSVREDILVQLSIIKNLILLGGLKVNPETARYFKIVESSFTPSEVDFKEREDLREKEVPLEEGIINL